MIVSSSRRSTVARLACLALPATIAANTALSGAPGPGRFALDRPDPSTGTDVYRSSQYRDRGRSCATPTPAERAALFGFAEGVPSDCSATQTNPTTEYDPAELWEIPVVVHILMDASCTQGALSDAMVHSQIAVLNEDFQAMAATPGAPGTNVKLRFVLATTDPGGAPTTGITRHCNTTWFGDGGAYYNALAWDPHHYLNIYTNDAGGALGYVPFLPADGGGAAVGSNADRVVILHSAFGRNASDGPPYDQGRTATHEVGHYLGLEHTFNAGCGTATAPGCYTTGDLICDTPAEANPRFGCPNGSISCSSPDPIHNYMDYTDDTCMWEFTAEQVRRMRCGLQTYRPNLYVANLSTDGFESGDTTAWTVTAP
jgi:hypothetical protein